MRRLISTGLVAAAALAAACFAAPEPWTEAELDLIQSLWIGNLGPVPDDPTNDVADDPAAAALGHRLFFDMRLSGDGAVACVTCHQPERRFTDGLKKSRGVGMAKRNALSIVGSAYSPWLYWDGRRDSLWSQALTPLEDVNEHGTTRSQIVVVVAGDVDYASTYRSVFGMAPDASSPDATDRTFANIGKALAAYERLLLPGPSRFDDYVEATVAGDVVRQAELMNAAETRGLRIFIGQGECMDCHNGPLLTNNEFHNTGTLSFPGETPDKGRAGGLPQVQADPFNCLGPHSDAGPDDCAELEFARSGPDLVGAFRTPSLRNLAGTAPFMHKGQLDTLSDVLEHYNKAPAAMIGHSELNPLGLRRRDLADLEAFLEALDAPLATDPSWLQPPPD